MLAGDEHAEAKVASAAPAAGTSPAFGTPQASGRSGNPANLFAADLAPALERNLALATREIGNASVSIPRQDAAGREELGSRVPLPPREEHLASEPGAPRVVATGRGAIGAKIVATAREPDRGKSRRR